MLHHILESEALIAVQILTFISAHIYLGGPEILTQVSHIHKRPGKQQNSKLLITNDETSDTGDKCIKKHSIN